MARSVTPLLLLVCIGNLYAQDLDGQKSSNPDLGWQRGYAIELGPGPLVCYERNFGGKPREVGLFAANCDGDQKGRLFWRNSGNVNVVARLDQSHILVASYGSPYALLVVDTKIGAHRVLAEGSPHSFVGVRGDEVLYLGDDRWGKGDNYLFARSWQNKTKRRKLAEPRFDSVPLIRGNLAIGVTVGENETWSISLTRSKARKIYDLPKGARRVRLALAPGAQRIAISASVQGKGHLAVVDLGSAKPLNQWDDLNIGVSPFSSSSPTVELGWFDDGHVVTSETISAGRFHGHFAFVRRNVETGKITDESAYGQMALQHSTPPPPGEPKAKDPVFTIAAQDDDYRLMQKGQKEPLQSVPKDYRIGAKILLAPEGAFAVVKLERNPKLCVLYRPGKAPLALSDEGGTSWRWLPASGSVESRSK